jgi:hypothetical protein
MVSERRLKDKKITFKIDSERFDMLHHFAESEDLSVSTVLRRLVSRYVEDRKRLDLTRFTFNDSKSK